MARVPTFYDILGVDRDASAAEIERAYRVRVKETHPDVADADGEEFKRATAARDVLVEPDARRYYDRLGHARYVHRHLNPENWPDVGDHPPRRSRGRGRDRRRRTRTGRRRSRTGDRTGYEDDSRSGGRSYTARVRRNRARRGVDVHGAHGRVRHTFHVSPTPQTNPYVLHQHEATAEILSLLERLFYSLAVTLACLGVLTVVMAALG